MFATSGNAIYAQQTDLLYRATVIGEDAVIHSGPGSTTYGTDRLRPGTEVDVYRHDPGGWVAIRPPKGSFSLVQRNEIELYENGLAKVTETETVAWVGTRLNPVKKPIFQVKLRQGEMLAVLGVVDRQQYDLTENEPDWVQITPPPGEFRWIAASDIQAVATTGETGQQNGSELKSVLDSNPASVGGTTDNRNSQSPVSTTNPRPFDQWETNKPHPGEWTLDVESGDDAPAQESISTSANALTGWKPARQTISNFVNERSNFVAESSPGNVYSDDWNRLPNQGRNISSDGNVNSIVRSDVFDARDSQAPTLRMPDSQIPNLQVSTNADGGLSNSSLQSLELQLTQEMVKPPTTWDLMPLAAAAQRARDASVSQQEAEAADRLLNKIRKCREIKAGYQATGDDGGPVDLQTMRATGLSANPGIINGANLLHEYDAHGFLSELVRDGGTGPSTFVLQDELGRVTHHITAPPGFNLRRYLNQRVGIIGDRGYHQQLKLDHVTAERVIAIDTLRR